MIALKRILVPTDFGETAAVALRYGRALSEAFGASLHLLHVLEDPLIHAASREYFTPMPNYRDVMQRDARTRLEGLLTDDDRARLHAEFDTAWGTPFVEIIRYAKAKGIDLIVMGSHGLSRVARLLMGSVAENVVRKAPCPVLTVRHPEHEFVMPEPIEAAGHKSGRSVIVV
jgi:nucleotide-binding universal stress UspA family protein